MGEKLGPNLSIFLEADLSIFLEAATHGACGHLAIVFSHTANEATEVNAVEDDRYTARLKSSHEKVGDLVCEPFLEL